MQVYIKRINRRLSLNCENIFLMVKYFYKLEFVIFDSSDKELSYRISKFRHVFEQYLHGTIKSYECNISDIYSSDFVYKWQE